MNPKCANVEKNLSNALTLTIKIFLYRVLKKIKLNVIKHAPTWARRPRTDAARAISGLKFSGAKFFLSLPGVSFFFPKKVKKCRIEI